LRGRKDPSPIRLAIRLLFLEHPPTGFRQTTRHGHGRLSVSFGGLEPQIQIHHMSALDPVLMSDGTVGRFDEGPSQKEVGAA
jgi:hypothetical protein